MSDKPSDFFSKAEVVKCLSTAPDDQLLMQACYETWFSNQLAWLMDPKGSHGLGVKFLNNFLISIGKKRVSAETDLKLKATNLKFGRGKGVNPKDLKLANSAVFREFYLARVIERKKNKGLYCDVVLVDLDTSDGIFLVVENKLFGHDSKKQLDEYHRLIEEKYSHSKIREFVYITLFGYHPVNAKKTGKDWVCLGWLTDIRNVLNSTINKSFVDKKKTPQNIKELQTLLDWLYLATSSSSSIISDINKTRLYLSKIAGDYLLAELTRLNEGKRGQWELRKKSSQLRQIEHTSLPSKKLVISLLSGLAVTVQSKENNFEKILIPFGAHPDQVLNLIDIAARDVYGVFFAKSSKSLYLADKRRLKKRILSTAKKKELVFLRSVYKHRHALNMLINIAHHTIQQKDMKCTTK